MKNIKKATLNIPLFTLLIGFTAFLVSCGGGKQGADLEMGAPFGKESLKDIIERRGLNSEDVLAAAKTYTPDNIADEYVALNSGGQAGNMPMYTVPSMRMLKYVPICTRQPEIGYGYSMETKKLMEKGFIDGQEILWGDTHHPGYSETNGVYDGKWATVNDKANPRIFIVSLEDWEVKDVLQNPLFRSDHGGNFFTPNSEYILEATQYPAPFDRKYYPLSQANFEKYWRGGLTYWKFDNETGKVDLENSFTFEFPPYTQDLSDAGKLASDGWGFTNSFCTEMYYGGMESGRPPFEAGCSSRDVDYLHVTNWKKAEQVLAQGKYKVINGHKVIPIEVSIQEGLLYLVPEPKSPHGVDVDPTGDYIVVAGKLDSHAWVYSFEKIMKAIDEKNFEGYDNYGIPIISLESALHGSVEVGLGPLHNQYDDELGVIYTSIYVDSRITKWDYINLKVLGYVPSHYNIGHLVSSHGDTREPTGDYLIALNKLSIDRFNPVGPLHPQNHQLIDISGDEMKIIYDLPIPMGEPHYTILIKKDMFTPIDTYPPGTDITTNAKSQYYTDMGAEKVVEQGGEVHVYGTISNNSVTPSDIEVNQGQKVYIHLTNHGASKLDHYVYEIASYDQMYRWRPGETATLDFTADKAGMYPLLLDKIHHPDEIQLMGYLKVNFNEKAENDRLLAYASRVQWDMKMQSFKPSSIEMKNMLTGEMEFLNHGCNACHRFGEEYNGPDLLMVDKRRNDEWLKSWIMNPEKHMKEVDIEAMRQKYKLAMPNQNVSAENTDKIIQYMKLKSEAYMKGIQTQ
ncbi:MAG TPA: Sec-dependent nitrous-oxide reductase [Bacteroidales bacterium]|nr:Sec-dependent nitrous-oxide reductase [Bacteroidales bacterium]HNS46251.1 Sec-dependent nitrous-oxide reductase [Bacteroidales bacterium]